MRRTFKRLSNDASIGGIGCAVSEFAGVALKGICVLRTLVFVAVMVIGAASASAQEAGEVKATVSVGAEQTDYYTFADAFAAAKAGYRSAADNGGTELVPTITLKEDTDAGAMDFKIGDTGTPWSLSLNLNGKTITTASMQFLEIKQDCRLDLFDSSTGETKGSIVNNYSGDYSGMVIGVNGGELAAKGVTISAGDRRRHRPRSTIEPAKLARRIR